MIKITHQLVILFLLALSTYSVFPGTTGKIAGTITDKNTGEPLAFASISVKETTLGAATDKNGRFVILQVPPGTYDLEVSYVGYQKVMVSAVRVDIDQTAEVNIALEEEAYQLQEMVVVAERKLIKPDVNTSVVSISEQEIQVLPVNNVISAIGLQAGIRGGWAADPNNVNKPTFVSSYNRGRVSVQGGLNIRGGDGGNILFDVDGVTMRDPRNNEPVTRIPLSSIEEISVERGGFNAEYGQVQSGVVNVVTKEGNTAGYSGNIQLRYSPPTPKYWRGSGILDVQDPYSFALRPFFDPAVCWVGTENGSWDQFTKDQYPSFVGWNEIARIKNTDNNPNNDITPLGAQRIFMYETRKIQPNNEPDFDIDAGFGGPVPFISKALGNLRFFSSYRSTRQMLLFPLTRPDYRDYDVNIAVNSDITSFMKLRFATYFGKQYTMRHNWDATGIYFYPRNPADIATVASSINAPSDLPALFSDFNLSLADVGHQSYAGKFTHAIDPNTFYEVSVEYFKRDYNTRPSGLRDPALFEVIPGYFENSNPLGYWPEEYANGLIITGGQHFARARDFSVLSTTSLKTDFTSQVDFRNMVRGGFEFAYNDLDFDYGTIQSGGQKDENYQNRVQMRVYPIRAAVYLQDKLEMAEFTVNAGLRLDYSNSNSDWWAVGPYDRLFFTSKYFEEGVEIPKEKSNGQWQLSPRLGVAHPITENSKLFFNYGHFKQLPQYESIFRVERDVSGSITSFGDPDLILSKTISYELGFDYIIFENFMIQMAGFYNDITDQQDFTSYISKSGGFSYTFSTSNNYQDTRGFEFTIRKTGGNWWSGFANYTYSVTTSGHFGSSRYFQSRTEQQQWDEQTVNLYQDRPIAQPYARVNLNFYTPTEFGPSFLGHNVFGGLGLNIIFDWQAGYWTAYNPGGLPYVTYNVQAVDYYNTYLKFDKVFDIGKFKIQLFVDINNVLNTKTLWNTGDVGYLASLHLPRSTDYPNIPGNDKIGDYREPDVQFQPMLFESRGANGPGEGRERAWFYDDPTGKYYEWVNNQWTEVSPNRVTKALEDKAYIDMPNASTFWFLNPRQIFFGIRFSFNIGR